MSQGHFGSVFWTVNKTAQKKGSITWNPLLQLLFFVIEFKPISKKKKAEWGGRISITVLIFLVMETYQEALCTSWQGSSLCTLVFPWGFYHPRANERYEGAWEEGRGKPSLFNSPFSSYCCSHPIFCTTKLWKSAVKCWNPTIMPATQAGKDKN